MNVRTTENCQKYREAKRFVKEYEKEYWNALSATNKIDLELMYERQHIVNCRNSLISYPNFNHLKKHIINHKKEIKRLLKLKYSL